MPIKYPKRPKNELYDICECGHAEFHHHVRMFHGSGQCRKCMCPKYCFEQQLKMIDLIDLEDHIRRDQDG